MAEVGQALDDFLNGVVDIMGQAADLINDAATTFADNQVARAQAQNAAMEAALDAIGAYAETTIANLLTWWSDASENPSWSDLGGLLGAFGLGNPFGGDGSGDGSDSGSDGGWLGPMLGWLFPPEGPLAGSEAAISPLVLDLDGDGIELTELGATATWFDLDADGFAERTGWVAPDDALLALDRDGNGTIDDITELFGNATTNGFIELADLDSDASGTIDLFDAQWHNLRLWIDADSDGISDDGNLIALQCGTKNLYTSYLYTL